MKQDEIDNIFTYHVPTPEQQVIYVELREMAKAFGHYINSHCPESREKSIALTKLQETVMMANVSIAIHGV